jgi:transposase
LTGSGEKRDINKIELDIKKRVADNEDVKLLDDIPGINTIQAASIMAEIGNIDQFESAERLQSYGSATRSDYGSADSYISKHSKVSNRYLATSVRRSAVTIVFHNTREFRESMKLLGIRSEYIQKHTPGDNGDIESFRNSFKQITYGLTISKHSRMPEN